MLALLVVATIGAGMPLHSEDIAQAPLSEYRIKAAYLYYFATFVTWPEEAFTPNEQSLVIGILGEDPFGTVLDETIQRKLVNGRPLVVKRFESVKDARTSQLLFISSSERDNLPYILKSLEKAAVLTIGESPNFASHGGQIGFEIADKRVRFEINAIAVRHAGLRISSQLMKLGKIVESSESEGE